MDPYEKLEYMSMNPDLIEVALANAASRRHRWDLDFAFTPPPSTDF
jgi:hypothetical protein